MAGSGGLTLGEDVSSATVETAILQVTIPNPDPFLAVGMRLEGELLGHGVSLEIRSITTEGVWSPWHAVSGDCCTGRTPLLYSALEGNLVVDNSFVYFHPSGASEVLQVSKAGGDAIELVHVTEPLAEDCYASDSSHFFYLEDDLLKKVPTVGGAPITVGSTEGLVPRSMAVDAQYVYIADSGAGFGSGRIWRFPKELPVGIQDWTTY